MKRDVPPLAGTGIEFIVRIMPPLEKAPERRAQVCKAILILAWLPAAWVNLGPFRGCHMDTWCYFAPAAFARYPGDLRMPMVGSWMGGDQAWAIHWPGMPWFYSLFTPWAGMSSMSWGAALFLGLWLLLGELTSRLALRLTGNPWLALAALAFVLGDRLLYECAALLRPEIPAAILTVGALLLFPRAATSGQVTLSFAGLAFIFFAFPLVHPETFVLGGFAGASLLLGAWRAGAGEFRKRFLILAGSLAAGAILFSGWVLLRPIARLQFFEHARFNSLVPPEIPQLATLYMNYGAARNLALALAVVALLHASGLIISAWRRGGLAALGASPWQDPPTATALTALAAVLAMRLFPNFFYYMLAVPLVIALVLHLAARLEKSLSAFARRMAGAGLALLVFVNGAALVQRTILYVREGTPDIRAELNAFADALPPHGKLVLPIGAWEIGVHLPRDRDIRLVTPAMNADPGYRLAYSRDLESSLAPGDIVLIDRFRYPEHEARFRALGEWNVVGELVHSLPSYEEYDIDLLAIQLARRRD